MVSQEAPPLESRLQQPTVSFCAEAVPIKISERVNGISAIFFMWKVSNELLGNLGFVHRFYSVAVFHASIASPVTDRCLFFLPSLCRILLDLALASILRADFLSAQLSLISCH